MHADYYTNKALSFGVPFAVFFLLLVVYPINSPTLWWILVVFAHTLGYVHFILGYYYQGTALVRKRQTRLLLWFFGLTALAAFVSYLFVANGLLGLLAIIAIIYFLIHGALNELTLMQREFAIAPEPRYFVGLVLFVVPFFLLSLTHPSFFFSPKLEFLNPPPHIAITYLEQLVSVDLLTLVSVLMFISFTLIVPVHLIWSGAYRFGGVILALTLATIAAVLLQLPLNYVILYTIALSFHFITWSLHFGQQFWRTRRERFMPYVLQHLVILVPLTLVSVAAFAAPGEWLLLHQRLFDGTVFITLSVIHVTTSFLNEPWVVALINRPVS